MEFAEEVGESSSPPRSYGSFGGNNDVIRNDVYNRLIENGNEEAISNPHFLEQLVAHFNSLPTRFLSSIVLLFVSIICDSYLLALHFCQCRDFGK